MTAILSGKPPDRLRFSTAHELGHLVLDHAAQRAPGAREEQEANAFAAAVLMPAELLREQYVKCDRNFERLCRKFGSSGAAMGRRLHTVI